MLDWLNGAKYFNQVDIKSRYNSICIMNEDVEKMVMRTKYDPQVPIDAIQVV
jgi:hypothetical protein